MHNTQLRCFLFSIVFLLLCTACESMYSLYDIGEQDKLYIGSFRSKKITLIATLAQDLWSEEGIVGWTVALESLRAKVG